MSKFRAISLRGVAIFALLLATATPALASIIGTELIAPTLPEGAPKALTVKQVQKALAKSTKLKDTPKVLYPSLDHARDVSQATAQGCQELGAVTVRPDGCVFGDPSGTKTAWLIGDSHAVQWFYAIDAIAAANHYKLIVRIKSSCDPMTPNDTAAYYPECAGMNDYWLSQIQATHPDVVIVASYQNVIRPAITNVVERLTELTASTGRLVIIGDTPRIGTKAPECLRAKPHRYRSCTAKADRVYSAAVVDALSGLASIPNVSYIDVHSWLCTPTICPPTAGNILLYRDGHHITGYAAVWLTPLMSKALSPMMPPDTSPTPPPTPTPTPTPTPSETPTPSQSATP